MLETTRTLFVWLVDLVRLLAFPACLHWCLPDVTLGAGCNSARARASQARRQPSTSLRAPLCIPIPPNLQILFYTPLGMGKLGESWSVYSWIQAAG